MADEKPDGRTNVCGFKIDLDEAFAYQTPKVVVLKDKTLGIFRLTLILLIVLYIFIFTILFQGKHLSVGDVDGVFRLSLNHPTDNTCDPFTVGCRSNYTKLSTMPYCLQNKDPFVSADGMQQAKGDCQIWDSVETAMNIDQGMLLPTRIRRYEQRRSCYPGPENNWACDGVPYDYLDGSSVQTTPGKPKAKYDAFVADIEKFTLLIDHQFRLYGFMQADDFEMNGYWHECPTNSSLGRDCKTIPIKCSHKHCPEDAPQVGGAGLFQTHIGEVGRRVGSRTENHRHELAHEESELPGGEPVVGALKGDRFLIGTLLHAANVDLDNTQGLKGLQKTLRHRGLVLVVHIEYQNRPDGGWLGLKIHPWRTPKPYYTYHISTRQSYDYKMKKTFNDPADVERKIREYNGIRIVLEQSGSLMRWDTAKFFITLTAALGLLAVATTLTELTMMNLMPHKKDYTQRKFHHSIDMNPELDEHKNPIPAADPQSLKEAGERFLDAVDGGKAEELGIALEHILKFHKQGAASSK